MISEKPTDATMIEWARDIMQEFVDRCNRGEASSVRTKAACEHWLLAYNRRNAPAPSAEGGA